MAWTAEQILALAPDASAAASGRQLANASRWSGLGCSAGAVWGLCQGSGKDPYRAQVDLGEPAFKCSCPSRKFPCKHGLGLLLLYSAQTTSFPTAEPPAWVSEWLASRAAKAEARAAKQSGAVEAVAAPTAGHAAGGDTPAAPAAAAAPAKSAAKREAKVAAGIADLEVWLHDVMRRGLAAAQREPTSYWEGAAARLVDAQAPGLARQVRELGGAAASGEGWLERLLGRLGRLHMLLQGYHRLTYLPLPMQAEVRTQIGWPQDQAELLARAGGISDTWQVLGVDEHEEEHRLRVRRTWLRGQADGRYALLLDFAHGVAPFSAAYVVNSQFAAELVYFEGALPLRALIKSRQGDTTAATAVPAGAPTIDAALGEYSAALAHHPWLELMPWTLAEVQLARVDERWWLRDTAGQGVPLALDDEAGWRLQAIAGGRPGTLFGEWDGVRLNPLLLLPAATTGAGA